MARPLVQFLDLLFPPRCVGSRCGRSGDWLCPVCQEKIVRIERACERCGAPQARHCPDCIRLGPWPFEGVAAAGLYQGPLRDAIRALKFGGLAALGTPLGALTAYAATERWGGGVSLADVVIPVPADRGRMRSRGVDHAAAIAIGLGRVANIAVSLGTLQRTRGAPRQVGLVAADRVSNLEGAFRVPSSVAGVVLLVDDVFTTGATARCAATVLAEAGARVRVAVVARADRAPTRIT